MAKARIKTKDKERFKLAAQLADVTVNDMIVFGVNAQAVITYRTPQQLFDMGEYMATVEAPVQEIKELPKVKENALDKANEDLSKAQSEVKEIKQGKEVKKDDGKGK